MGLVAEFELRLLFKWPPRPKLGSGSHGLGKGLGQVSPRAEGNTLGWLHRATNVDSAKPTC